MELQRIPDVEESATAGHAGPKAADIHIALTVYLQQHHHHHIATSVMQQPFGIEQMAQGQTSAMPKHATSTPPPLSANTTELQSAAS